MALNTKTSIVDYLKSKKQDSSFGSRSKLAQTHGIKGYAGTAGQNTALLKAIQSKKTATTQPVKPSVTTTAKPTPVTTTAKPAVKTTATATKAPTNNAIQEQGQLADDAMGQYQDFLKDSSESFYDEQKAMLDSQKSQRLTELQKAYDEAVADGMISQEEAEKQMAQEVEAINADAYTQSQATELSAQSRGIGNSQQLLAMQQGDQRHALDQRSEARVARDERINQIKERLSRITNNHNLDVSATNDAYNNNLRQARAQADMQYSQGMGTLTLAQYKSALEMKNQLTLQEQQQLNELERMEKQFGYDLSKMDMQNEYTLGQMEQQYNYDLGKMDRQQEYTQDNMNLQYKLDLGKMKTQHGYDMAKMDKAFSQDLTKMARQNGYDMAKISAQHRNQLSQISASKNAQMQAENKKYELERARVKAAYTKGTEEYNIRMAQIDDANQQSLNKYHQEALYKSMNTLMNSKNYVGTPAYEKWISNPGEVMQNPARYTRTGLTGYSEIRAR